MSRDSTKIPSQAAGSRKMLQAMVGIGVLCALLIVLTFEGTLPRIDRLKAAALEKAIFRVLPGAVEKSAYRLGDNGFSLSEGDDAEGRTVYAGFDANGELAGVVIEASGQGYADIIRVLYGYDPAAQKIVGFYVLESKETPGLGDKIEKDPAFLANFTALDVSLNASGTGLENAIVPVKSGTKVNPWEVDAITGATISSRAIGTILGESAEYWVPLIHEHAEDFIPAGREYEKKQPE